MKYTESISCKLRSDVQSETT